MATCWNYVDTYVIALSFGLTAALILLFILDYFDIWIFHKLLRWFFNICAGGDMYSDRNQDVSVQEDGKSIPLQEIADNHTNLGHEAQDEEDSSNE